MSRKSELINVIKGYKEKHEQFKSKVDGLQGSTELTPEGIRKRVNEMAASFEVIAQSSHDKALEILDKGMEELESKWRKNSVGKLSDLNYQIGLANTIKMIETGAITEKEDFKNIIEVYKDDYNALATIGKLVSTNIELSAELPKDNRQYNKKVLNDLRSNIEKYINPSNILDSMSMAMESLIQFIQVRLQDDFTVIPWEEIQQTEKNIH